MKKLKSRWSMLIYACSAIGVNFLNLMMGTYLCSALLVGGFVGDAIVNQTFLGKDAVLALEWGAFVLIAKIIDGVIDIPMASVTDNLKTRWGRRRPSIFIGLVLLIASYLLFVLFIPNNEATMLNTVYFGILLFIFYSSYTLTMVSYYATFTEIVETEGERNFISNVKSVCDVLYFIIGYVLVGLMLKGMNVRTVAMVTLPMVLFMLIPLFMIKEPSTKGLPNPESAKPVDLFKSIGYTVKDKSFMFWMIVYFFLTFGIQLYLGGINEYFSTTGMSMMIVMASAFAPVPFTLFIYNLIIKKKGFRFAIQLVFLVFALAMSTLFIFSFVTNETFKLVFSIVGGLLCSFAVGAIFSVAYSIPSQLAADDEKKTNISHSAMYFAVQGLFSGIATGIATGVVLVALKQTGTVAYLTLISAIAFVVAFAFTFILPRSIVELGKVDKTEKEAE